MQTEFPSLNHISTASLDSQTHSDAPAALRNDWSRAEIAEIYQMPVLELIYRAATVHRAYHKTGEVQVCTLLSVKTGGCPEDCAYCPQAARYQTAVKAQKMMTTEAIVEKAVEALQAGSTRFCMGAAWREVREGRDFDRLLEAIKKINHLGMEVCCTLGMLTESQAQKLKDAGLYAYNHNLDTSPEYYNDIISTRGYEDRLQTLENIRKSGISVCSGGIIGMGEAETDRIGLLHTLATLPEHPESVPVNALVPVEGTPLEAQEKVSVWEMVRMIATARIIMPKSMIRLSAGRVRMSLEEQALCFLAGANSIFAGDKLLTTPNPSYISDQQMFQTLQLTPRKSFQQARH
jgi:biotin synthase